MDVYEPREDSYLTQSYVEQYAKKGMSVLDMGTGSGIQAFTAAKKGAQVLGTDINPEAIKQARMSASIEKLDIRFVESDLFESIKQQRFDLIVFNPPYLPQGEGVDDIALVSKKRGIATTEKFLRAARSYLADDGKILLISSSLADTEMLEYIMQEELFDHKVLEKQHIFFEDIILYELKLKPVVKELRVFFENIEFFDRGKRGFIHTATYKGQKVAIKSKRNTDANIPLQNEIRFLQVLNKKGIGPTLCKIGQKYLAYYFVTGGFIEEFIERSNKKIILDVLERIFEQLHSMDTLGINKFEMHHPVKHIIITKKNKPVMIDFERCRYTQKPKNITQFCDFLMGEKMNGLLRSKGIDIDKKSLLKAAKQYKKSYDFEIIGTFIKNLQIQL